MIDIKLSKKKELFIIAVVVCIAGILRFQFFDSITFGYDQARDAFQAMSIFKGDFVKVIGPATDIPGLFHGVLYWYLIAPVYGITGGSIFAVKLFLVLINIAIIVPLYYIFRYITKNTIMSLFVILLYAISFEANQYARWLSHPPPALLTSLISFYGLWRIAKKDEKGIYYFLLSWPLSVHLEMFFLYHILYFIVFVLLFCRKRIVKLNPLSVTVMLLYVFAVFSPFILAELKFNFQSTKAISTLFFHSPQATKSTFAVFPLFLEKLSQSFSFNIAPLPLIIAGIIFLICIIFVLWDGITHKKFRTIGFFLIFLALSPFPLFLFKKITVYHIMTGNLFGTIGIVSYCFVRLLSYKNSLIRIGVVLFAIVIVFVQLTKSIPVYAKGEVLFSTQDQLILKNELKLIDWTYQQSKGKPFAINTLTNPLYINTNWSYLYNWYGKQKYGRMPVWLGYPQEDYFGGNTKFSNIPTLTGLTLFLIMESPGGIPDVYFKAYPLYENTRSKYIEQHVFGTLTVERRIMNKEVSFQRIDVDTIVTSLIPPPVVR